MWAKLHYPLENHTPRNSELDQVSSTSNVPKDIGACVRDQSFAAVSDLLDWSPLGSSVLLQGMFVP